MHLSYVIVATCIYKHSKTDNLPQYVTIQETLDTYKYYLFMFCGMIIDCTHSLLYPRGKRIQV